MDFFGRYMSVRAITAIAIDYLRQMSSDKVPQTTLQQATATEIMHANQLIFFAFVLAVSRGGGESHK